MKINLLKSGSYLYKFAWIITELVNIILSYYYITTNKSVLYFEHISEALFFSHCLPDVTLSTLISND